MLYEGTVRSWQKWLELKSQGYTAVSGDCYFGIGNLISLEGSPIEVGGDFHCNYNRLTSLRGAPRKVGGGFYCSSNQLTTIEGEPGELSGKFDCRSNPIDESEITVLVLKYGDRLLI